MVICLVCFFSHFLPFFIIGITIDCFRYKSSQFRGLRKKANLQLYLKRDSATRVFLWVLPTFNKWGVFNIIGFKTAEKEETKFVNFAWHKICAKYENHVLYHNVCSTTKDTVETYVTGTSIVKNSTKASFSL